MLVSATISKDCKSLTLVFSSTGTYALELTNHITETEYSANITTDANKVYELSSVVFGETFNGVFEIKVGAVTLQSLGDCEISCCIAGLLHKVINCDCECDKCDEDLHTAQKVRLLTEAAKYSTYSTANLTDAVNKYNKAKEFCDADCGCGC